MKKVILGTGLLICSTISFCTFLFFYYGFLLFIATVFFVLGILFNLSGFEVNLFKNSYTNIPEVDEIEK